MNSPATMNRETALRIALAARALPDTSVGQLVEILHQQVNGPLTEQSLQGVTVTDLKIGLAGSEEDVDLLDTPMAALKEAVRILWGETVADDLPQPVALSEVPAGSIRVAIASNNGAQLDGHFGTCLRFLVYQVSATAKTLIGIRSTLEADQAEDKNAFRTELIADCQVLYVVSIGGPAAAKVVRAGIHPLKKPQGGEAEAVLAELQQVMAGSPPPWLAKLLGRSAERSLRFAAEDEDA
ncbi:dinitrogenase iron-molybdenum cofactor biosynthesis protein [Pseudomonas sp. MAP12]|uniref:Dinitrogenase iron-molybdenum cofactor biosynthesis protein n=1 Tax=Geopseudomonas aromaticivorans TaxID=2849492 RepID=A0ABS6MWD5_9GAMM|nr:dinitrogenase iron-molybdenum cofactor biosynthesis protein [Pseudomonas aromaticivorans]MBV2133117.1 dinitrogenase iron-molybdenum cofactor biosynthesis protein [Pseudomonas aromaticivorans]